jgi:hypothetical protein
VNRLNSLLQPAPAEESKSQISYFVKVNAKVSEMPLRDTDHLSGCGHHVTAVSDLENDASRSTKATDPSSFSPTHASQACEIWKKIQSIRDCGFVILDGSDLDVASVIAVAK